MNDSAYETWRKVRKAAPVPAGFTERVLDATQCEDAPATPRMRLGWTARAALLLLALGALLFRIGSSLAVILST